MLNIIIWIVLALAVIGILTILWLICMCSWDEEDFRHDGYDQEKEKWKHHRRHI